MNKRIRNISTKIGRGLGGVSMYLWDGMKMLTEDVVRKVRKQPGKKRNLKAFLKEGAAAGLAMGTLVFGGMKAVDQYRHGEARQYVTELENDLTYLYQKYGLPIDPKSPVWDSSNKNLSKLTQQGLEDRQEFLEYVGRYLEIFVGQNVDRLIEFNPQTMEVAPLKPAEQRKLMIEAIGRNTLDSGKLARLNPKYLRQFQMQQRASTWALWIVDNAMKQKSNYGRIDVAKDDLKAIRDLRTQTRNRRQQVSSGVVQTNQEWQRVSTLGHSRNVDR